MSSDLMSSDLTSSDLMSSDLMSSEQTLTYLKLPCSGDPRSNNLRFIALSPEGHCSDDPRSAAR